MKVSLTWFFIALQFIFNSDMAFGKDFCLQVSYEKHPPQYITQIQHQKEKLLVDKEKYFKTDNIGSLGKRYRLMKKLKDLKNQSANLAKANISREYNILAPLFKWSIPAK